MTLKFRSESSFPARPAREAVSIISPHERLTIGGDVKPSLSIPETVKPKIKTTASNRSLDLGCTTQRISAPRL